MAERMWLSVLYHQKDSAKAAGARWDPQARRWYAPRPGMTALDPWLPPSPPTVSSIPTGAELGLSDDLSVLLRDVTGNEPLPWVTPAPLGWLCHRCDSTCRAGDPQEALIQPRRWRSPLIVVQPHEWRHHLQRRGDVHWHILHHITRIITRTLPAGTAARWNPNTQTLETVAGRIMDWRDVPDPDSGHRH